MHGSAARRQLWAAAAPRQADPSREAPLPPAPSAAPPRAASSSRGASSGGSAAGDSGGGGGGGGGGDAPGTGVPHRWRLVLAMAAGFVLCNMDKVNMSVAVIPMASELGWGAADRGIVSGAFFWGYALTQVPAGWVSTKVGGAKVLGAGVALWSLGTLAAPPAAQAGLGPLCASRVLVGLGEGFAPAAATSVLARQVPSAERARAVATVWGGLDVGSVVGLLACGPLIRALGWPSVFYLFAGLGLAWCVLWPMAKPELEDPAVKDEHRRHAAGRAMLPPRPAAGADAGSSAGAGEALLDARGIAGSLEEAWPEEAGPPGAGAVRVSAQLLGRDPQREQPRQKQEKQHKQQHQQQQHQHEKQQQINHHHHHHHHHQQQQQQQQQQDRVPWGAFLTSRPVWAVTVAHFCYNWGYYTLLAWLPSYFELALGLDVQGSSFLTLIPYVAMVLMTPVVGPAADALVARGWPLTSVRKLAQGAAFLGPAACMAACAALTPVASAAAAEGGGGIGGGLTAALVALLSLAFALGAWSRAGLYCNHQDLSPRYASALLGITNTAGALPGALGVSAAGYLLDATGSWAAALFLPTAACQLFGAAFYTAFASSERQPWS